MVERDCADFKAGEKLLDKRVFFVKPNRALLHEVVRWQLAKKRSGTRRTKSISDIKATTRKPYRQKGTGRARQGSLCSPQFRGGAVIFGPVVRSHGFHLNKKVRKLSIKMALSQKLMQQELMVVDNDFLNVSNGVNSMIDIDNLAQKKGLLLIVNNDDVNNIRYIHHKGCFINVLPSYAINVYNIIEHHVVLLTQSAVIDLNERLL